MDIEDYRDVLAGRLEGARERANDAREKQYDPQPFVEMEFAKDLAERCEKLLMIDGLADRIHALEDDGLSREEIAIALSDDFAEGNIGNYDSKEKMVDAAIRTAVALLTEGVVAAPIDGIGDITIEQNDDGSDFIRIPYYGPIRSAGGTGQALSILVADYIRQKLGISQFKARDDEIERYVEELHLYDREVSLQYMPKDKEIRHIIENCSVMIDGVQTTKNEVEGYRDLERIDGNRGRGGMCLVVGEGVAQKAPKIQRYTSEMDIDGWDWLNGLSTVTSKSDKEDSEDNEADMPGGEGLVASEDAETDGGEYQFDGTYDEANDALKPKEKFIADLIAGRPVFSDPSATGGFRLRYGRARNMGLAACGYSPASMTIFDEFIATGTQLKTERPGKAAGVSPVDSIEGPTVRLANGEMRRIDDVEEAERVLNAIEEIIDVGEVAVPYGEFLENNHPLLPASYVHEWWIQEYEAAGGNPEETSVREDSITAKRAFDLAEEYDIPLHPKFTYLWDDITLDQYESLSDAIEMAQTGTDDGVLEYVGDMHRETLESLLVPHRWDKDHGRLYLDEEDVRLTLKRCCATDATGDDVRERAEEAAGITVRERAPVRIGARMGRPEKSKRRETKPHALFPIGDAGGNLRDIETAAEHFENAEDTSYFGGLDEKKSRRKRGQSRDQERNEEGLIYTTLATRRCPECSEDMWSPRCPNCDCRTAPVYSCPSCGEEGEEDDECGRCDREYTSYKRQPFDVKTGLAKSFANLKERPTSFDTMKGVKGLASKSKIPEPLEKGILRAKHDLKVFRDGTARYDMMDIPLTSFCADDIGADVETLRELGYDTTLDGEELEATDQLVEMYPQDIILAEGCGQYMLQVANFIDELLVQYYDEEPYYNADEMDDLIGELILGLAPHTSAGVLGRIVGFNPASANFASPFYHAGKRRNCDGDEDAVMLLMDGLLNFSKQFLPDKRGKRSVGRNTPVFVERDGNAYAPDIGNLVDEAIDAYGFTTRPDGFEVCRDFPFELKTPAFDEEGHIEWSDVSALIRHPNDKDVYRISTGGEPLTLTGDHGVFVHEDGRIEERDVRNLKVGDNLVVPSKLPQYEEFFDHEIGADLAFDFSDEGDGIARATQGDAMCVAASMLARGVRPTVTESEDEWMVAVSDQDGESLDEFADLAVESVVSTDEIDYGDDYVYDFEVPGKQNFLCGPHPIFAHNTMDAPLVVSTVLDPLEVDDEAHNVDIPSEYPLDFYEETYRIPGPKEYDMPIAEDITDTGMGFQHSLETDSISAGPTESAYKSIAGMDEKTFAQLNLARATRAVNEDNVAEMVIEKHFMPDIIGNLSAFARQSVRCPACNEKYRRAPLGSKCRNCGGNNIILTVHEGSVKKYVGIVTEISDDYDVTEYTRQRIEALSERIDALFEDDHNKQTDLSSFL